MGFIIIWSNFAEIQLDKIFHYYKDVAGSAIALKNIKEIILAVDKLNNNPAIGQIEELLKDRTIEYRYFLHRNYKVIYSIDKKELQIRIADIFDTRQNPVKIKRHK